MIINKNILTVFCFVMCSQYAFSQQNTFKGLISIGINAAQIDGDGSNGYDHIGAIGGVGTMVEFKNQLSVSFEMLYSMRGSVERRKFRVSTDYIELPFCLNMNISNFLNKIKMNNGNLNIKKTIIVFMGLSPAVLVRYNLKYTEYDGGGNPTNAESHLYLCLSHQPAKYDLSALAGLQFHITSKIAIGARYSYSLMGIKPSCNHLKSQYHNVVALKAAYIISNK